MNRAFPRRVLVGVLILCGGFLSEDQLARGDEKTLQKSGSPTAQIVEERGRELIRELEERLAKLSTSGNFVAERAARRELLPLLCEEYGDDHWKSIRMRRFLESVSRTCELSSEQQGQIAKARKLGLEAGEQHRSGDSVEANETIKEGLRIYRELQGESDIIYVTILAHAYEIRERLGLLEDPEEYSRVLDLRLKLTGQNDPESALIMTNLANLYVRKNEYQKAERMRWQAIKILKNAGEPYNVPITLALVHHNLARDYNEQKKFQKAESAASQASNLLSNQLPEWYPVYITIQLELARSYTGQQEHEKALAVYERVVKSFDSIQNKPPILLVADVLDGYATALSAAGDQEGAEKQTKQAASLREIAALKTNSARTVQDADDASMNENDGSQEGHRQAKMRELRSRITNLTKSANFISERTARHELLALLREQYGDDDWRTIKMRLYFESVSRICELSSEQQAQIARARKLGIEYDKAFQARDFTKALEMLEEGLRIYREIQGESDIGYVEILGRVSELKDLLGLEDEARENWSRTLKLRLQLTGENDPESAVIRMFLADLYLKENEYRKAAELLLQSNRVIENVEGPIGSPYNRALLKYNLARAFNGEKKYREAESAAIQACDLSSRQLPKLYPMFIRSQLELARSHMGQNQYSNASARYKRVLEILDSFKSNKPPTALVVETLEGYVEALESAGDQEGAEAQRARAARLRTTAADRTESTQE